MNTVLRKSAIALAAVTLIAGLLAAGAIFAADIKLNNHRLKPVG